MFSLEDDSALPYLTVKKIHDERGFREVRRTLSQSFNVSSMLPHVEVTGVDLQGDRILELTHYVNNGQFLDYSDAKETVAHIANLWGYPVHLKQVPDKGVESSTIMVAPAVDLSPLDSLEFN